MDLKAILQMAGNLKRELSDAQAQIAESRFEGEAGGGLVRVLLSGKNEVLQVTIEPQAAESLPLLQELVRAAFNDATQKQSQGLKDRMGGMVSQLGIDPSMLP
jgi:DNA-binding YbaB/EbfC family protein